MGNQAGELQDHKAVVVGAGAIGTAIATGLAQARASIALTYASSGEKTSALVAGLAKLSPKAIAVKCDVTDADATRAAFEQIHDELGGLDIVVSAIGAPAAWKRIADLEPSEWQKYLAVDLSGTFHIFRAAVPLMRKRGGAIVVLSSIAASLYQTRNGQGAAAKAGVEALVRTLAREEGRHNIRVNAIEVGLTESPSADEAFAQWGAESSARVVAQIPLRRIATPQDVADAALFLAGPRGRYITGKVLGVDGGQYIGH